MIRSGAAAPRARNTVGNLVLHLQGNVGQWIIHGIGGAPDIRDRPVEFSTAGGKSTQELSDGLRKTVTEAMSVISG